MGKFHGADLTGQRFGKLTVMERNGINEHRQALWKCACSCGNEITVSTSSLKNGNAKSCGCLGKKPRLWKGDYTITYNGRTQTVSEWAEEVGISYFTLYRRLSRGWDVERALTKK